MTGWRERLVSDEEGLRRILRSARRITVLGIRSARHRDRAAYTVPAYLRTAGYEIVPVPVGEDEDEDRILGRRTYDRVAAIPGPVDLVLVFRRPEQIPAHVPDILDKAPGVVWFQLGIRNDEAAERIARAGIQVVQDRCIKTLHRRFFG